MKKIIMLLVLAVLVLGFVACGGGDKYGEAKALLTQYTEATEAYVADLEKAGSADDVAAALNKYTDAMEKLAPQMKGLQEKYPELKNEKETPEDMKPIMERLTAAMQKMFGAMGNTMQYAQDAKVQEAQARFQKAMQSMQ